MIPQANIDINKVRAIDQLFGFNQSVAPRDGETRDNGNEHRYRVSGLLTTAEEDGFRLILGDGGFAAFFEQSLNEIFRYTNQLFTRAEMEGSVKFHLPENTIGEQTTVTIWETDNRESVTYLQQRYFEFEFTTDGVLPAGWNPVIECSIMEMDSSSSDDVTCDGDKQEYNIMVSLPDVLEPIYNRIVFKLKSSTRTINDLPELLGRIQEVDFDNLGCEPLLNCPELKKLVKVLEDASGVWVQNLTVTKVTDTSIGQNQTDLVRVKGYVQVENVSEAGQVEPYGQIYIVPGALKVTLGDIEQHLKNNRDIKLDIPGKLEGFEFTIIPGFSEGLKVYDHQFSQNSDTMRSISKDHRFVFDKWLPKFYDDNLMVFGNVWEKDDGGINLDDCWFRGNAIGFDQIGLDHNYSVDLSACQDNKLPRLKISFNEINNYKLNDPDNEVPWKLETALRFYRGDGSNKAIEPYGNLSVTIPSPQGEHASSPRIIWNDDYRSAASESLPVDGNSYSDEFYSDIYFNSYNDLTDKELMLTFPGNLKESDSSSGDDNYYGSDEQMFTVDIDSNLLTGLEFPLPREASNDQKVYLHLKLVRGNDNPQPVLVTPGGLSLPFRK